MSWGCLPFPPPAAPAGVPSRILPRSPLSGMDERLEFPALTSPELPGCFISAAAFPTKAAVCQRLAPDCGNKSRLPPSLPGQGRAPAPLPSIPRPEQREAGIMGSPFPSAWSSGMNPQLPESTSCLPRAPRCCLPTQAPPRARKSPAPHPPPAPGALHHKARGFPRAAGLCLPGSPGADEVLMERGLGLALGGETAASRFPGQLEKQRENQRETPPQTKKGKEWGGSSGCRERAGMGPVDWECFPVRGPFVMEAEGETGRE